MSSGDPIKVHDTAGIASLATAYGHNQGGDTIAIQVTIQPAATDPTSAGTVALYYKARGARYYETLKDEFGAAVVLTFAASTSVTRAFTVAAESVKAVSSATNGKWDLLTTWYR